MEVARETWTAALDEAALQAWKDAKASVSE